MKSLTIRLPEPLLSMIEAEARERKISKSDVVRDRLEQGQKETPPTEIWTLVQEVLEESWRAEVPVKPTTYGSPHKQRLANLIRAKKSSRR